MHLHTTIISYNRVELLERCYRTYKQTVACPHTVTIVDNASEKPTIEWLVDNLAKGDRLILLGENRFPGYACNRGWETMPAWTTHLHRSDNDFEYLPGWTAHVAEMFASPQIGQVGLRTDQEEQSDNNVGGNNVIRRELWDKGLRYDERPWGDQYPVGWTEDSLFSPAVKAMGYHWRRVKQPCIVPISTEDPNDPYYQRSWALRGISHSAT